MVDIINFLDPSAIEFARTFETYLQWKKDFTKLLKEWDKIYVKHSGAKGTTKEMNELHMAAMNPLNELITANENFHNLEVMIAKPGNPIPVPEFRLLALEEKFCEKLTTVCEIFKDYGTDPLVEHFNIRQMLKILKIPDWRNIKPFMFILTPMDLAIKKMRKNLLDMGAGGVLYIKYIVENNTELLADTKDVIKKDVKS